MKRNNGQYSGDEQPNGIRQKAMFLLIPVLAVVLWLLIRDPAATIATAAAETPDHETIRSHEAEDVDWEIPPIYQSSGRDPMQLAPPAFVDEDSAEPQTKVRVNLTLRGILYSEDESLAMIGTSLVHEGQQVSGATVVKIDKDSVEFEMDGRRWKQVVSAPAVQPHQNSERNRKRPARVAGEPQ
jgi:type II secretory pathway component PulC